MVSQFGISAPIFRCQSLVFGGAPILINIWLGESRIHPSWWVHHINHPSILSIWKWDSPHCPKNFQDRVTKPQKLGGYHLISPSNRAWSKMFRVKTICKTIAWELQQIWMDCLVSDLSDKYLGLPVDLFRHLPSNQVNPFHLLLRQLCQVRQG